MDDLDAYFGDDAVNAFVNALDVNLDEDKGEFARKLVEDEEFLLSCLSSNKKPEEEKKVGKVIMKRLMGGGKTSEFSKMNIKQLVDTIANSEIAGAFFPKDPVYINNFVLDSRKKDVYEKQDLIDITRMLIKKHI